MTTLRKSLFCLIVAVALAGCQKTGFGNEAAIVERQRQADRVAAQIAQTAPPAALIHDRRSVLGILEANHHGDRLPPACEHRVTLRSARPLRLVEIAARLSQILDLPVQVEGVAGHEADEAASPGHGANGVPPAFPAGEPPPFENVRGGMTFQPDLSGSCSELFDRVAGQFDVEWRIRSGILHFDREVVRTFPLKASATTSQLNSTLSSGGNSVSGAASSASGVAAPSAGATAAAGSAQSASVSTGSDIWGELDAGLKTLVGAGGRYAVSRSSGTVTVIATPKVMADVGAYIDQLNKVVGATIAVEVSAIYVTVDDTDNYGLDLNALYQAGAGKLAFSGLLPTLSQAPGTGSIAILSPPGGVNNFSTHFAGSQLFLNAVSSSNRLADYRSATVAGRNGVAMPITLTTNQDIVRSLQFAVGLQSGAASTSAATSSINYGFSLQVLPRLIGPDIVSVFISFTANDLINLQDFPVGNAGSLELATIDSRSLWNESPLRVGQTLVIAGTEQERVNPQKTGIGAAGNWLFGGQFKNEVTRTRLILLVTPTILATPT